jgi:N-acyl-D-amino-acid deacylase
VVDAAADLYLYTGRHGVGSDDSSWAHEGGPDALKQRLADPQIRERLKHEIKTGSPGWWNIIEAAGGWDGVVLSNARNLDNMKYAGKSMTAIAKEMGKDPAQNK